MRCTSCYLSEVGQEAANPGIILGELALTKENGNYMQLNRGNEL